MSHNTYDRLRELLFSEEFIKLSIANEEFSSVDTSDSEIMRKCNIDIKSLIKVIAQLVEALVLDTMSESEVSQYELAMTDIADKIFLDSDKEDIKKSSNMICW